MTFKTWIELGTTDQHGTSVTRIEQHGPPDLDAMYRLCEQALLGHGYAPEDVTEFFADAATNTEPPAETEG